MRDGFASWLAEFDDSGLSAIYDGVRDSGWEPMWSAPDDGVFRIPVVDWTLLRMVKWPVAVGRVHGLPNGEWSMFQPIGSRLRDSLRRHFFDVLFAEEVQI